MHACIQPYQEERLHQIRNLKLEDRNSAGIPEEGFPERYNSGMFKDMTAAKRFELLIYKYYIETNIMRMSFCMYVCMYVFVCKSVCMLVRERLSEFPLLCILVYVRCGTHTYIHIYIHTYTSNSPSHSLFDSPGGPSF